MYETGLTDRATLVRQLTAASCALTFITGRRLQKSTSLPPQPNLKAPLTVATGQLHTHYEELLNDCAFRATLCITVHSRTGHIVASVIAAIDAPADQNTTESY